MAIFDGDTIKSTGTKSPGSPNTGASSGALTDQCRAPGNGMPEYNGAVLLVLRGQGKITQTQYNRVKAGTLSIDNLNLAIDDKNLLHCNDEQTSTGEKYDAHFDADFTPQITAIAPDLAACVWNINHTPVDRAHKVSLTVGANNIGPGVVLFHVAFATNYADPESEKPVAPVVSTSSTTPGVFFRAITVTPSGYDLISDGVLNAGQSYQFEAVVTPTRKL